jgi:hypothetical protein
VQTASTISSSLSAMRKWWPSLASMPVAASGSGPPAAPSPSLRAPCSGPRARFERNQRKVRGFQPGADIIDPAPDEIAIAAVAFKQRHRIAADHMEGRLGIGSRTRGMIGRIARFAASMLGA